MQHTHYHHGIATLLLCSLLWHGCQSDLRMQDEKPAATDSTMAHASSSSNALARSAVGQDDRKRPASDISQGAPDTEEKKESPGAISWRQPLADTHVLPRAAAHTAVTQESQESGIVSSQDPAVTALAKTTQQDAVPASEAAQKKEDQDIPADLKRWFKDFAEAVDDEDVLYHGDISEAIPRLVQEGKEKGYLTQSMIIAINELGWEPNCTPLHYAAAKGSVQAVRALLAEAAVVIDAKTEDQYGSTPLHFAAYEGHAAAAKLLLNAYNKWEKMAEIDAPDSQGSSALQYAAGGPRDDMNRQVATLLVANGADPTQCSGKNNNITLVDFSAMCGNYAMVEYWIDEISHTGRFTDDQDKELIKSAMRLARRNRHPDIAKMLKSYYEGL